MPQKPGACGLAMRAAVREAGVKLRTAGNHEEIWKVVKETAPHLQAACVSLRIVTRNGTVKTSEFVTGFDEAPPDILRARFSLLGERPDEGRIELGFADGRRTVDRDTEIAIELLCEHVHGAVERIAHFEEVETTGSRRLLRLMKLG